jgi:hypothetical protein
MMRRNIGLILILIFPFTAMFGQSIPPGKYIGLENMYKHLKSKDYFIPGIYHTKETDTTKYWYHSDKWFHEVTIEVVSDTCVNISKVPVYFMNGNKFYSDSIGGFFNYECAKISTYSEIAPPLNRSKKYITGYITECKYCHSTGSAVPKYVNCHYDINFNDHGDLLLTTEFGEIIYKKEK